MHMKKIHLLSFCFLLITLPSFSQWQGSKGNMPGGNIKEMMEKMKVGRFYGKVVDSTSNKGVEFASVQLIGNMFDTVSMGMKKTIIAGQLTESNGDFSLSQLPLFGKLTLKITAIGYNDLEKEVSFNIDFEKMKQSGGGMGMMGAVDRDLGNIKLSPSITALKAVEIIGTAPVLELKLDKKVFNVEKNMISTGGTAEDVLKQVPSVNVDMDGNVTMRNAAPQIFVDGKPTTLTIDQIPADAIQSVELITNPSAKYEAAGGQGGILNIVLKKEKRIGYNGNIRAGIDQRGKANGGADINVREGKLNAFISANLNQRYSITEGKTQRENLIGNPLTNIYQDNYSISDGLFAHTRGGIDWFADNRNTFTFSGNYVAGKFEPVDELNTRTDTIYPAYTSSTSYERISKTGRQFENKGATFQYKHLFPKAERELTADINYNKSSFTGWGDYSSNYFNGAGDPFGNTILQDMSSKGYTEILSGQLDYIYPLNEKSKIETGIRGTNRNFLSKTENFLKNDSTGEFELIKNQSSNYKFNDQVYAGYVILSRQKEKFTYQLGLRGESSFYTGELIDSNKTFKNYFPASLFPSISGTYDLNGKDNFQLSYSRRINRPTFFQLIPFTDYSDSLNLKRGNASLKPEFTHSFELSYLKTINQQNNVLISAYYKTSNNLITSFQKNEYDSVLKRNAVISTYENANASYAYGGELTSKHTARKWLEFTCNINAYYSIIDAKNIEAGLKNEKFSWFAKLNITIKPFKNFSIQLTPDYKSVTSLPSSGGGGGRFSGPTGGMGGQGWMGGSSATAQGYVKARYEVDAAIKYEFLKNKAASISVNVRDIFASDNSETITESDYFNQTSLRIRDPQFVRVNFSYRFGKFDTSLFRRKNNKVNMDGMEIGM